MRKIGLFITIITFFSLVYVFSLDGSLKTSLYTQANDLFQKASVIAVSNPEKAKELYKESLQRFLQISEGSHNGQLYYNIGNIYFQLGDMGNAIFAYKKASLFIPGDRNLKENLAAARELRLDKISEQESSRLLETIFFFHYNLSASFKALLFAISLAIVWISTALLLLKKKFPPSWGQKFLTSTIVFSIISIIFLGSLLIDTVELHRHPGGVITVNEIIARKGDGEAYSPSFKEPLHSGMEFTLINKRPGWYYIKLADNTRAWVPKKAASLVLLD